MAIKVGNSNIKDILIGENPVIKVYKGEAVVWKRGRLPSEYQEVEYLTNNSSSTIVTNIHRATKIIIKVKMNVWKAYSGIFGNYIDENSNTIRIITQAGNNNGIYATINSRANYSVVGVNLLPVGKEALFKLEDDGANQLIYLDNVLSTHREKKAVSSENTTPIALFRSNSTTGLSFNGNIYFFQSFDGSTLTSDFVPCYRKSDNKPGMYDLVTNTFFTNQGSGEFIVGPDVN